jgi:hypothetical protein
MQPTEFFAPMSDIPHTVAPVRYTPATQTRTGEMAVGGNHEPVEGNRGSSTLKQMIPVPDLQPLERTYTP